ncbi:hypothetical protein NUU61_007217 [Penicillium alfredii]|uniref:Urease accessory protein UreF n=1 Tax=Penicillium alfredii TaxID=1506179 RepID=A0A9W9F2L6_9EURO|nr:uncharacterized protein NUU61_007217 [Penicillium alfredii]KAJ5092347.1 hypothetical protein NUU61_007217 [Penicillium alfredii]
MFLQKPQSQDLQAEVAQLESRLQDVRAQLAGSLYPSPPSSHTNSKTSWTSDDAYNNKNNNPIKFQADAVRSSSLHALLLLSDSALPLGSFAYSSGLESYLAHNKPVRSTPIASFNRFLRLSIASIASTSLPYVLAGYREPEMLETLDNDLDASTPCVLRQPGANGRARGDAIDDFSEALKSCFDDADELGPRGHFAPLWGVVCRAMGLDLQQTAYIFVLNHAKAILSAAVRASVMGPYQAQNVLASQNLQDTIMARIKREWNTEVEQAGQVVPALDLWVGRHELLYSRIFNS